MTMNRRIDGYDLSEPRLAVHAAMGMANDRPQSIATGTAPTNPHDRVSSKSTSTTATPVAATPVRPAK